MADKIHWRRGWIVAVGCGLTLLVGMLALLPKGGMLQDTELVDEHGNVVGYKYSSEPSLHRDLYVDAARLIVAGENKSAERAYRELVDLEPDRPDPYIGLGSAQAQQFNLDGARKSYAAALKIDPTNPAALCGAGTVERKAGNLQLAKDYFAKSLSNSPDDLLGIYGMAIVCSESGERHLAKKHADRIIGLSSDSGLKHEMLKILNAPD